MKHMYSRSGPVYLPLLLSRSRTSARCRIYTTVTPTLFTMTHTIVPLIVRQV